jgi:hypothetical protein
MRYRPDADSSILVWAGKTCGTWCSLKIARRPANSTHVVDHPTITTSGIQVHYVKIIAQGT